MLFYWSVWIFFCIIGLWCELNKKRKGQYPLFIICMFILALIVGGREYVGTDWESYRSFYEYGVFAEVNQEAEPLFDLIRISLSSLDLPCGFFFFFVSFVSLVTLSKAFKLSDVPNYWLAFLAYLSLVFCHYQLNVIRHGLMASMVLLSYSYRANNDNKRGLLFIILAIGVHKSAVLFLLLYPLVDKVISKKMLFFLGSIAVVVYALGSSRVFGPLLTVLLSYGDLSSFADYLDTDRWGSVGALSIGTMGRVLIFIYLYFFNNGFYNANKPFRTFVNLLLFSIVLVFALGDYAIIIERLSNALTISLAFLIPYMIYREHGTKKWVLTFFMLVYLALYYPIVFRREEANMLPFVTNIENVFVR